MLTPHNFIAGLFLLLLLVAAPVCACGQDAHATPADLARASFDAYKKSDWPRFASYFEATELERLKVAATYVFQINETSEALEKMRSMFAPYTKATIASASGAEILSAMMRNFFKDVQGVDEMMATVTLKILGEIEETPDAVHLVVRTVFEIGRPEVISCQKRNGQWRLLLKQDALQLVAMIEQQRYLRAQKLPSEQVAKRMSSPKPEVLGYVKDGDEQVQVLCRVTTVIDKFQIANLLCYPVRPTDNAWQFLGDKAKFAEAYRKAWPF